jgi:hypothetical protein
VAGSSEAIMTDVRLTGGCQCGAIRYVVTKQPERPCICHCRMCQKAGGNAFGIFAGVETRFFELTRGTPASFRTSDEADRLFCSNCGTQLAWKALGRDWISMTIGSFDNPVALKPIRHYGEEGRLPWIDEVVAARGAPTGIGARPGYAEDIEKTNHQHPDHDTDTWTPHPSNV